MTGRTGQTGVAGVTVTRDGSAVLRDVTLLAGDGELLVVLGSSGSGKSTLLRVIAGLARADRGDVLVRGRRVTDSPPGERHVSMVFESSALVPFLDVSRNLGWGLKAQRLPEAEVQQRVTGRARQLRLSRLLPRRPDQLSEGERGLVGIGKALVRVPDAFLLDEPLAHLDAAQRVRVRRQIVEVVRSLHATTFYVTHDQAEALAVADRLAMLHEGAVVQVGKPMDLYERPVDLVVCGFVGSPPIGLLPARLVESGGLAGFAVGSRDAAAVAAGPGAAAAVRRAGGGGRPAGRGRARRGCRHRPGGGGAGRRGHDGRVHRPAQRADPRGGRGPGDRARRGPLRRHRVRGHAARPLPAAGRGPGRGRGPGVRGRDPCSPRRPAGRSGTRPTPRRIDRRERRAGSA